MRTILLWIIRWITALIRGRAFWNVCMYVLKPEERMYLKHRRDKAVYEDRSGLYKWNIDCAGKNLII